MRKCANLSFTPSLRQTNPTSRSSRQTFFWQNMNILLSGYLLTPGSQSNQVDMKL
jgi:hypothetical protein